jgi:hypothetical protein
LAARSNVPVDNGGYLPWQKNKTVKRLMNEKLKKNKCHIR